MSYRYEWHSFSITGKPENKQIAETYWVIGKGTGRVRVIVRNAHTGGAEGEGRRLRTAPTTLEQETPSVSQTSTPSPRLGHRGESRLVAVVRGEWLAAGGEVVGARRGALRARQRGGRRGGCRARARSPRPGPGPGPACLAQHVSRFPHGRSYNTPNTKLFINHIQVARATNKFRESMHRSSEFRGVASKELNVWWMLS